MGFLKAIARLFTKILKAIKKIFTAIMKRFPVLLLIFAVCCFIFPALLPALIGLLGGPAWMAAAAAGFTAVVSSWGPAMQVAAAVGAVALVSPGTIKGAVGNLGDAANAVVDEVGDVVGNAGGAVVDVVDKVAGGLLTSNTMLLVGGAFLAYFLLTRKSDPEVAAAPAKVERDISPPPNVVRSRWEEPMREFGTEDSGISINQLALEY